MSKDYRSMFIRDVEAALTSRYAPGEIALISNIVIKSLSNYEITERCTEIAVRDDINDKLIRRYRACLMVDGKSERTIDIYVRIITKLSEMLGKPFPEMGAYDVRFFLAMCQEKGVTNRTLENYRAYCSSFFQWMADDEIIPKNPILSIKPIKYNDEIRLPFTDIELDSLRGVCNERERAVIEFLVSTGVRVSELTQMRVEDVDFETLAVHVKHGKGGKERITYMTPVAATHLRKYLSNRKKDSEFLIVGTRGTYTKGGIERLLHVVGERAEVADVHPHRFRRTFATNLSKRGMDIQEIQKLLGHATISTTMIYVNTDDTRIQSSYKRYNA